MKRKIFYFLLIILTFLTVLVNGSGFSWFLLSFEILFAIAMAVWAHLTAKKIKTELELEQSFIFRGDQAKAVLTIQNPAVFPVSDIQAGVILSDPVNEGRESKRTVHVAAGGKGKDQWQFQVQPVHCGIVKVQVRELRLYDYLGVFYGKISAPLLKGAFAVLPRIHPIVLEKEPETGAGQGEQRENVLAGLGSDSQEIFDTRAYQRGDAMKNIHWKLSAKAEELMVKEFSMPMDLRVPVFLDTHVKDLEKFTAADKDRFLDLAASLGNYFVEHQVVFEFCWMTEDHIEKFMVEDPDSLYYGLRELLMIPYFKAEDGKAEVFLEKEKDVLPVRILTTGEIYVGDQMYGNLGV